MPADWNKLNKEFDDALSNFDKWEPNRKKNAHLEQLLMLIDEQLDDLHPIKHNNSYLYLKSHCHA